MIFGKYINRYYLKYWYAILGGVAALIAVDYAQLLVPELYREVINGMNTGFASLSDGSLVSFDMQYLLDRICLPMIFIILFMVIGRFVWRICLIGTSIRVETDLRRRMFDHCRGLSQQYYQSNKVGTLMSYFTNDLETVQDCFGWGVLMFFDALCLGAMALWKMKDMSPLLTFFALIPMLLLLSVSLIIGKYITLKWENRQEAFSRLSDFSQESFSGIAVIKAFVREGKELSAFRRLNRENEDANVAFVRLSVMLDISVTLLVESVVCVILGYGGYLVYVGSFDAGQLVEFIGYFTATVWPIMAVSEMINMTSQGRASLKRISSLLDAPVDVLDRGDVSDPAEIRGDIELRDLTFCYPGESRPALSDVSFKINAGENVGIIGRTGSGKTTLVDLILRTYNVPDGCLFIDGRDVNTIPIRTVRDNAAYVPQDNFLFSDTIRNNIAFASDSDDTDAAESAARLADVHDNIIGFADGYGTVLGERGVTVSGGQKQRISIARALMKDAPILILDDAVSAVDVGTERTILDNLAATRRGKTTVLIAHRVSTVERMDKIIYLDDGRVLGVGTHSELMESCAEYRRAVELQRLDDAGKEAGLDE